MPATQLMHLRLGNAEGEGKRSLWAPESQETYCDFVPPTNDKKSSPMISQPDGYVSKAQRTPPGGMLI